MSSSTTRIPVRRSNCDNVSGPISPSQFEKYRVAASEGAFAVGLSAGPHEARSGSPISSSLRDFATRSRTHIGHLPCAAPERLFTRSGLRSAELLAVLAGELDELRGGAGILVDRVTVFVGRDHLAALYIGHRCGELLECRTHKISDDLFAAGAGVHLRQGLDPRCIIHWQAYGIFGGRQCRRSRLLPVVEETLKGHGPLQGQESTPNGGLYAASARL